MKHEFGLSHNPSAVPSRGAYLERSGQKGEQIGWREAFRKVSACGQVSEGGISRRPFAEGLRIRVETLGSGIIVLILRLCNACVFKGYDIGRDREDNL